MRNDYIGSSDVSGNGSSKNAYEDVRAIKQADGTKREIDSSNLSNDGSDLSIEERLEEERELNEIHAKAMAVVQQWQGLLPPPEEFSQYPKHVQDKMVEWNDAQIINLSKRQDRLVDGLVKATISSQWLTFAMNIIVIIFSGIMFILTKEWISFTPMVIPSGVLIQKIISNFTNNKE